MAFDTFVIDQRRVVRIEGGLGKRFTAAVLGVAAPAAGLKMSSEATIGKWSFSFHLCPSSRREAVLE
jgi:hypothetical protein